MLRIVQSRVVSGCLLIVGLTVAPQIRGADRPRRAEPPRFDPQAASQIFFEDVFAKLKGNRPEKSTSRIVTTTDGSRPAAKTTAGVDSSHGWPAVISRTVLEDEVKALKIDIDKNLTTPADFAGRGHKQVRRDFSVLATLFAVINEYDSEVRWKRDAAVARDLFARAAANAKAGASSNVYKEAKERKLDLQDLVSGASLTGKEAEPETDWMAVADHAALMQRLESGFQGKLSAWVSNDRAFASHSEGLVHEAEMIAMIGKLLALEEMEYSEEEEYVAFANRMSEAARGIAGAVQEAAYERARLASGEIGRACSECHDLYR